MNKPTSIKVINVVLILKLIVTLLVLVFGIVVILHSPSDEVWRGIKDSLMSHYKIESTDQSYMVGKYIGMMFFPILFMVLGLVFLKELKYRALSIVFVLQVLIAIGNIGGLLINLILLLIIIFDKNAKNYLKKQQIPES